MMSILPVYANGGTYVTVKARDVVTMAHNAIAEIENNRTRAVREQLKECMEEECVHRIPLLGVPFYRHKRYPTVDLALEYAPEIQQAKNNGWGDLATCEGLKEMALWLINESGYPEELQVMHITLNDFRALN
jgi:lysophospholipase L1-like esterase